MVMEVCKQKFWIYNVGDHGGGEHLEIKKS
jgi:hypothetical protein